jgi:hypothetical protein
MLRLTTSWERRDSVFLFLEFGIFVFNYFFYELISSKRKANDFFPGTGLVSV